jgi:lysophospholipase L1-like esterase
MKLKHIAFNVVILTVASVLALLLAEGVLRLKNSSMQNYDIEMWRYAKELKFVSSDKELGHEHLRNAAALLQSVTIRINEWGLRGGPVPPPQPGARRILFLGASITLGWGVAEDETMTALLARKFAEHGAPDTTVLNAGIGNYNAQRYVELFLTRLAPLKPTDVVVHYFLRDAEPLDDSEGNWLLRHSELAVTLWIAWHRLFDRSGEASVIDHYKAIYRPDSPGFRDMRAALVRLAAYARDNNVRLYLTVVPDVHDLEHYRLQFAHEMVGAVARELGYAYLDLLPYFGTLSPQEVWAMPGDPHPNARGHAIMADAIYPLLAR